MHTSSRKLRGVLPALVTPFDDGGSVDEALFMRQVEYMIDEGVAGFFVSGTTAEGVYVTAEERYRMVSLVRDRTRGELLCCAAVLAPDTNAVLRGIDAVSELEPDFFSAVTPFYSGLSQADLVHHFTTIADLSPAPLILYNIPQNTYNTLRVETTLELAKHPNIAGIKDSSGDFLSFQRGLLAIGDDEFTWIQGEDLADAPAMLMGARCLVTGMGNAWITPYVAMYRAAVAGDSQEVIRQQARINELFEIIAQTGAGTPAIKCAAALQGRSSPRMRLASMELGAEQVARVEAVLEKLGLATTAIA